MNDEKWTELKNIPINLSPEILKGLLEANGIPVILAKESAGTAIGITVGPMGEIDILVPEKNLAEAQSIILELDE